MIDHATSCSEVLKDCLRVPDVATETSPSTDKQLIGLKVEMQIKRKCEV